MNAPQTQESGPAADPLAVMDVEPKSAIDQSTVLVSAHPQLPAVLNTKITRFGSLINISQLPQAELVEIDKLAANVFLESPDSVMNFGFKMQKEYSEGLSSLMGNKTIGDTGLSELIAEDLKLSNEIVQEALQKFGSDDSGPGTFRKIARSIPWFGEKFTTGEVLLKARERLTELFDRMEAKIAEKQRTVLEGSSTVKVLSGENRNRLLLLRRHVAAGERIYLRMNERYKAEYQALPPNPDPMVLSDLNTMKNLIVLFEDRLIRLAAGYVKAGTLYPKQLETLNEASQLTLAGLQDILVTTIPDIKFAVIELSALNDIESAQRDMKSLREQQAAAEDAVVRVMGETLIEAKKGQGQVLTDVERLRNLLTQVGKLNDEVAKIEVDTAAKRKKASELLEQTLTEFTEGNANTAKRFAELQNT